MSYTLADLDIFASKASARALEAGFESMLDYYYCLRYDDPEQREFQLLVETLLVHETFFFREFEPLRVRDRPLRRAAREGGRARAHLVRGLRNRRGAGHHRHAAARSGARPIRSS